MAPTVDLASADYAAASRRCDVVMKGGITSGIVYPHAICELARQYRFKNVGGTSAGAIAAAATAAAERGRDSGGFAKLAELPGWLSRDDNLVRLFQPQKSTRPLHRVLMATLRGGTFRALLATARSFPFSLLAGALPGVAIVVLALIGDGIAAVAGLVAGIVLAGVGAATAVAIRAVRLALRATAENGYGICSGMGSTSDDSDPEPLTAWLASLLQSCAGPLPHEGPLTFGDLWAGPDDADPPGDAEDRYVDLAMMTTNLTNRCADRLPLTSGEWFFDPAEFRTLFPDEVVRWMEDHPAPSTHPVQRAEGRDSVIQRELMLPLRPMPAAGDLPVVVATRMSLSFPVLLSAVPLWRVDWSLASNQVANEGWRAWRRAQGPDWDPVASPPASWPPHGQPEIRPVAERCWFSDGGISSNLPIHFFDSVVPRWPTFAINLRPYHPDADQEAADQEEHVWMVPGNRSGRLDWWYRWNHARPRPFWKLDRRLGTFLSSVVFTMQNRVDEAQQRVPGFRDRIAHVSLADDEGGMNLSMPAPTIEKLTERGRCAGEALVEAFTREADAAEITWDNHRWVRLRSALAAVEELHRRVATGYGAEPLDGDRPYAELLERAHDVAPKSYRLDVAADRELARQQLACVVALTECTEDSGRSLAAKAPRPLPEARIVPRI